jgi:hypothetical protein
VKEESFDMCLTRRCERLGRAALVLLLSVAAASVAGAQTLDEAPSRLELVLRPGTTVWVTDRAGREQRVRIVALDGGAISGRGQAGLERLALAEIVRIRARQADSLVDGVAIGFGAAVASGLFVCTRLEPWDVCRDDVGPLLGIGAIGAGIGLVFDAILRDRRIVYERGAPLARLEVAPLLGRARRGVRVSLRF